MSHFESQPSQTPFAGPPPSGISFGWLRWFSRVSEVLGKAPQITTVPATDTSPGVAGQIAYDTSWLYICVAPSVWRRVAISTW